MAALLPPIAAACDTPQPGGGISNGTLGHSRSSGRFSYADIAAAAKSDVTHIKVGGAGQAGLMWWGCRCAVHTGLLWLGFAHRV